LGITESSVGQSYQVGNDLGLLLGKCPETSEELKCYSWIGSIAAATGLIMAAALTSAGLSTSDTVMAVRQIIVSRYK